jgi:Haem-NO-binding
VKSAIFVSGPPGRIDRVVTKTPGRERRFAMYGIVNKAIRDLIVSDFGVDAWNAVKERAGVELEFFVSNEPYPDDISYRLVGAASDVLSMPAEDILIRFGEHWVTRTGAESYGSLLKSGGGSLREFLLNLPDFHARVALLFPQLQPPEFTCSDVSETSMRLHYFTHRPGLTGFVFGLLQGLSRLYETPVVIRLCESKADGADHDIFELNWSAAGK